MRIRLTRKLANSINGIDLAHHRVGDVLDLPPAKAHLLVAEEWATAEERRTKKGRSPSIERRKTASTPLNSPRD
jgi:hypothetical protein